MASRPRRDGSKVYYLQLSRRARGKKTGKPKDIIPCPGFDSRGAVVPGFDSRSDAIRRDAAWVRGLRG
jgi:hypothetical protein